LMFSEIEDTASPFSNSFIFFSQFRARFGGS
jgi:hypothetical protein